MVALKGRKKVEVMSEQGQLKEIPTIASSKNSRSNYWAKKLLKNGSKSFA
jgi:hypothetical protein